MSFKNKIVLINATILILFVGLLTYSAIQIVQWSSEAQLQDIKKSITDKNKKFLTTFVKSQSVSLDKEVELIFAEVEHITHDFAHDLSDKSKDKALLNKQLIYVNSNLKPFVKQVHFIDMARKEEASVARNVILNRPIDIDLSNMTHLNKFYIEKEIKNNNISKFSIYIRFELLKNSLLKFDIDLDYFSNSLIYNDMIEEFNYRYFLIDSNAKIIASNLQQNVEQLMSESVDKNIAASYIMLHDSGSFSVSNQEGVFDVTFVKNRQTGWRLLLVTPEHVVHSNYKVTKDLVLSGDNTLIERVVLIYIILLGLFLVINFFVIKKMLKPISQLVEQANYLKLRDFNNATQVVRCNGDEIEQLSKAYCEAATQVKNLIEGLEYEVDERARKYEVAAQEANEANKQKSVLLSNVSHEIRTPLNAIIGYTHMLLQDTHFNAHKHQLNGIDSASHTILAIVNDLLDFDRIKAANFSLDPKCLSVVSLISEIEKTFLPLCNSKQLSFNIVCDVAVSTTLMIDELRIKQAISNIVSNALKFTKSGGVTITISKKGEAFNIAVSDTGIGIPKDKLEVIFSGYEQVNQEDQQFGFGLGLAITKTIVELMNGTLRVKSELGVGSTFVISLPALEIMDTIECYSDIKREECNSQKKLDYTNKKALIVDDVEFNREILEFHLKVLGFECMNANDGLEALTLASMNDFDVVLTDISMPVMDGFELASKLAECKPLLPIIAVTARATANEVSLISQHFSCYLTKPINPNDLNANLHRVLSDEAR